MNYKVWFLENDTYQVVSLDDEGYDTVHYQGSLADCDAWIRLRDGGYL